MFLPLFHLCVVLLNLYSLWYDQQYLDYPLPAEGYKQMPFKARHIFMTTWCFLLQTVYFSLALLNDIAGNNAPVPSKTFGIRMVKDTIFSFAFPIALYVSSSFWIIYSIDKELMFSEAMDKAFPVWLNHTVHTLVSVFIIVELILTNKSYPPRKIGCIVVLASPLIYIVWLHLLYERTGAWPYPILGVLKLQERAVYFICCLISGVGFYLLGEKLNSLLSVVKNPKSLATGEMKRK